LTEVECSSSRPWDRLSLAMLMPLSIIARIVSSDEAAGPKVQTIFVLGRFSTIGCVLTGP